MQTKMRQLKPSTKRTLLAFIVSPIAGALLLFIIAYAEKTGQLVNMDAAIDHKLFISILFLGNFLFFIYLSYVVTLIVAVPIYIVLWLFGMINCVSLYTLSMGMGALLGNVVGTGDPQMTLLGLVCGLFSGFVFYRVVCTSEDMPNNDQEKIEMS